MSLKDSTEASNQPRQSNWKRRSPRQEGCAACHCHSFITSVRDQWVSMNFHAVLAVGTQQTGKPFGLLVIYLPTASLQVTLVWEWLWEEIKATHVSHPFNSLSGCQNWTFTYPWECTPQKKYNFVLKVPAFYKKWNSQSLRKNFKNPLQCLFVASQTFSFLTIGQLSGEEIVCLYPDLQMLKAPSRNSWAAALPWWKSAWDDLPHAPCPITPSYSMDMCAAVRVSNPLPFPLAPSWRGDNAVEELECPNTGYRTEVGWGSPASALSPCWVVPRCDCGTDKGPWWESSVDRDIFGCGCAPVSGNAIMAT